MTRIADLYLYLSQPNKNRRKRLLSHLWKNDKGGVTRFVVLSWKRTGSNLFCGMLHFHPEICMHNELFNPIDIFTYHPQIFKDKNSKVYDIDDDDRYKHCGLQYTTQVRDLYPVEFLEFIWNPKTIARCVQDDDRIVQAVGFKSFPEHWIDVRNEGVWREYLLEDWRVRKIILWRRDELAVYISMQRADLMGRYMTHKYPSDLKIHIDPATFQSFINNYRHTFRDKYISPTADSFKDTFWIEYEEMVDEVNFETNILPKLWEFLGVDSTVQVRRLRETIKQADPDEDLSCVISNYEELEFCFRHSDVLHFERQRRREPQKENKCKENGDENNFQNRFVESWSILLPICSRPRMVNFDVLNNPSKMERTGEMLKLNTNRFTDILVSSQYNQYDNASINADVHWNMLEEFCRTLKETSSKEQLALTECIVGIDDDDLLFQGPEAKDKIRALIPVNKIVFVDISCKMYGQVCKIWNLLAEKSSNDFIVLLGDDVRLLDYKWQEQIVARFHLIAKREALPFGAACVAMNDLSFPGFPTFPVLHRWHIQNFGSLLPR